MRVMRGGGIQDTTTADLVDYMAIENPRDETQPLFGIGVRCAINP